MVTIVDIAKLAKTSKSTVSRCLNGGIVGAATRKAIEAAIRKLDYHPNINARRLVSSKTRIIGIVLDDISNVYYSQILCGVQGVAAEAGYVCTFYSRASGQKSETDYLKLFQGGEVDGLILGTFQVRNEQSIAQLATDGHPIVLIGDSGGNSNIDSVDVDNRQGTIDEVRHLHELGHRAIAYLKGPRAISSSKSRLDGYLHGMQLYGLKPGVVLEEEWTIEGGERAVRSLLARKERFTALMCSNEHNSFGAIKALRNAGLRVPDDISVVTFDDGVLAQHTEPSITTVRQPFRAIGGTAARQLLSIIEEATSARTSILIHPTVITRASSGRAKAGARKAVRR
jgi:DNA-binding LacI/PurR family transcriptional regulator